MAVESWARRVPASSSGCGGGDGGGSGRRRGSGSHWDEEAPRAPVARGPAGTEIPVAAQHPAPRGCARGRPGGRLLVALLRCGVSQVWWAWPERVSAASCGPDTSFFAGMGFGCPWGKAEMREAGAAARGGHWGALGPNSTEAGTLGPGPKPVDPGGGFWVSGIGVSILSCRSCVALFHPRLDIDVTYVTNIYMRVIHNKYFLWACSYGEERRQKCVCGFRFLLSLPSLSPDLRPPVEWW